MMPAALGDCRPGGTSPQSASNKALSIGARLYAREVNQIIEAARSRHRVLDVAAEAKRIGSLSGVSEAVTTDDLVEAARGAGLHVYLPEMLDEVDERVRACPRLVL